jgi:O-antigen ligase
MTPIRKKAQVALASDPWYDKAIRVCYYVMVAAVPAVFSPLFYTAFSLPKLVALVTLNAAAVLLWGFKVLVEGKITLVKSRLNWLLLIYAFISLLNVFFSVAPFTSIYGAENRFLGILTIINFMIAAFMVLNFFRSPETIRKMISVSLVTAVILALYGLMQYFGVFDAFLKWNADTSDRVFGTVGHGNHFGAYLGMNIVTGVFFFPYIRKNIYHVALALGLVLMASVLFLTASRGALFATLITLTLFIVEVIFRKANYVKSALKRVPARVMLLLFILLIAAGLISGEFQRLPIVERTVGTVNFIQQGNVPDRLSWWASTLEMIKARPVLGFGLSTYRDVYNAYRRTDYRSPEPGDMQDMITPEAAHNELLNIAATQGLVGLGVFLTMVFYVFWGLAQVTIFKKEPDRYFMLAMGVKGALCVYLVQVLVSFGVITTLTHFYIFLALGGALAGLAKSDYEIQLKFIRLKAFFKYVTVILAVGLGCGYLFLVARAALAEYNYRQALVMSAQGDLHGAIVAYQNTLNFRPGEWSYYQGFGDFALKNYNNPGLDPDASLKMLLLAEVEYANAIGINPYHPSLYYNFSLAQLQIYKINGNYRYYQSALINLDRAVNLAVNNPLYPYQAAKALMGVSAAAGETVAREADEKALKYLEAALLIRPGYRDAAALADSLRNKLAGV